MQVTVAALNSAPELHGLAHDLWEISDRLDLLADMLQFPEPGDPSVEDVYMDLMDIAQKIRLTAAGVQEAAETVGYAG